VAAEEVINLHDWIYQALFNVINRKNDISLELISELTLAGRDKLILTSPSLFGGRGNCGFSKEIRKEFFCLRSYSG